MEWIELFDKVNSKVDAMVDLVGCKSPHVGRDGKYDDMDIEWWTSGFWPGLLWVMYDMTGKEKYKNAAWDWDVRMAEILKKHHTEVYHDVEFQFLPTAVIK